MNWSSFAPTTESEFCPHEWELNDASWSPRAESAFCPRETILVRACATSSVTHFERSCRNHMYPTASQTGPHISKL